MSDVAIRIEGLGKRFVLGSGASHKGLHEWFERVALSWVPGRPSRAGGGDVLWALRDIDLEIDRGELVGLVGHNGAGKSVLLKVLSRITWPTEGRATVAGSVGSMLEVGAGFHPEFSGRENLYLVGATLGMSRRQINARFDEIVAFAEVEEFLDTPVKRYSSGMCVRLAFSVAASLDAQVMMFDEVIAVGDEGFREKAMGRIREMAADGRTVIFVSHNMESVQRLCSRVVVLDHGRVRFDGPTEDWSAREDAGA